MLALIIIIAPALVVIAFSMRILAIYYKQKKKISTLKAALFGVKYSPHPPTEIKFSASTCFVIPVSLDKHLIENDNQVVLKSIFYSDSDSNLPDQNVRSKGKRIRKSSTLQRNIEFHLSYFRYVKYN